MGLFDRIYAVNLDIITAYGTYELDADDIVSNTLSYDDGSMEGEDFNVGSARKNTFSIAIKNTDGQFDDVQFSGSILQPSVGVQLADDSFEYVPLGYFIIDTVDAQYSESGAATIYKFSAFDYMAKFEKPFSKVTISYPCTAYQLITAVCLYCGVPLATSDFLNDDLSISAAPTNDPSCRDMVSYVAQLAGCFARIDRSGFLELAWFDNPAPIIEANVDGNTDDVNGGTAGGLPTKWVHGGMAGAATPAYALDPDNRFDTRFDDAPIMVSGVQVELDEQTVLAAQDKYAITIIDNPLIQSVEAAQTVASSLWQKFKGFCFLPFTSHWVGDPALQAGDMIAMTDAKGRTFRTIVTQTRFSMGSKPQLACKGRSQVNKGYIDPMKRVVARLRSKIQDKQEQLNAMDLAARSMFALFSGLSGGFRVNGDDLGGIHKGRQYLCMESADPTADQKVWAQSVAGTFLFPHGINQPPESGWTTDNQFLVGMVTADVMNAGTIRSNETWSGPDGAEPVSWFNMDDGTFSFGKGALVFDGSGFPIIKAQRITNLSDSHYFYIGTGSGGLYSAGFNYVGDDYFVIEPYYTGPTGMEYLACDLNFPGAANVIANQYQMDMGLSGGTFVRAQSGEIRFYVNGTRRGYVDSSGVHSG
jgi:hypothetical protein